MGSVIDVVQCQDIFRARATQLQARFVLLENAVFFSSTSSRAIVHAQHRMPPRVQPQRLQTPCSRQRFRTRPNTTPESLPSSSQIRHFNSSESRQRRDRQRSGFVNPEMTRLRRNMMEWLNGPGKAFREPLQNSTNYMSAYDRQGNLLRGKRPRGPRDNQQDDFSKLEDVIPEEEEAAMQAKQRAENMEEYEIQEQFEKRAMARAKNAGLESRGGVQAERLGDMRPYPLNHAFRSERVLSEELREAIYNQVVARGVDISTVSAMFSIDIRRVAAVVRLKSVEKQWVSEVWCDTFPCSRPHPFR